LLRLVVDKIVNTLRVTGPPRIGPLYVNVTFVPPPSKDVETADGVSPVGWVVKVQFAGSGVCTLTKPAMS
jgi:hypothetical protein